MSGEILVIKGGGSREKQNGFVVQIPDIITNYPDLILRCSQPVLVNLLIFQSSNFHFLDNNNILDNAV